MPGRPVAESWLKAMYSKVPPLKTRFAELFAAAPIGLDELPLARLATITVPPPKVLVAAASSTPVVRNSG